MDKKVWEIKFLNGLNWFFVGSDKGFIGVGGMRWNYYCNYGKYNNRFGFKIIFYSCLLICWVNLCYLYEIVYNL